MRNATLAIVLLVSITLPRSAAALTRNDTMAAWALASAQERASLLDELQANGSAGHHASRSAILACMNSAAGVGGHDDIPIKDLADACANPARFAPDDQGRTGI